MAQKGQGPILVAGQTASGKSSLALDIAEQVDGIIVNADSMQVYRELQILSARPLPAQMRDIPHSLYGHVPASTAYSVGHWMEDMETELAHIKKKGKRAIIVGGTGLYFKALLEGLSPVPDIAADIRQKWRQRADDPQSDLHAQLQELDPQMAQRLNPGDRQRLARALEVREATGKSLLHWQQQPGKGLVEEETCVKLALSVDRAKLYTRCDERLEWMVQNGALQEVEELLKLDLPPSLPAMRALGVRPLGDFLAGRSSEQEALAQAKTETRQYAKRQGTWLRSNMIAWNRVNLKDSERFDVKSFSFI